MKALILAGALMLRSGRLVSPTGSIGWSATADRQMRHRHVNPIITGDIWFEDGPYKSLADAKLARSTISACPEKDPPTNAGSAQLPCSNGPPRATAA